MRANITTNRKSRIPLIISMVTLIVSLVAMHPAISFTADDEIILDKKGKEVDFSELHNIIEEERKKLDERKKELKEQEALLKALQSEIAKEYKQLMDVKKELEKEFIKKEEKSDADIKGIVKLYEAMSPEEAAKAIEKMTTKLAAQLISQMNARKSGKILDAMNTSKVKDITKEMYEKQKNK